MIIINVTSMASAKQIEKLPTAHKYALLIGIDNYNFEQISLSGCVKDVNEVRETLINVMDFDKEKIIVLENKEATRNNILMAIKRLSEQSSELDEVFFYYSGHGYQFKDESGDETDGLDETLCPVDTEPYAKTFAKTNMILDDELGLLLSKVKSDKFTIIYDCCHSGTGTRGIGEALPEKYSNKIGSFVDRGFGPDGKEIVYKHFTLEPEVRSRDISVTQEDNRDYIDIKDKKKYIFISSAGAWEKAAMRRMEGSMRSVFTYFLVKGLKGDADSNRDGSMTYVELFDYIRKNIKGYSEQKPQLEADYYAKNRSIEGKAIPIWELAAMYNPEQNFKIKLWVNELGSKKVFKIGERASFSVKSEINGYLYLIDFNSEEKLTILSPNPDSTEYIQANETRSIKVRVVPPINKDIIIAIITSVPLNLSSLKYKDINAFFKELKGKGASSLVEEIKIRTRDIKVVDKNAASWGVETMVLSVEE